MLVYMLPANIDELKGFAIDDRRPVSDIIEESVETWLEKRRKKTALFSTSGSHRPPQGTRDAIAREAKLL
jgi:hypothetical protein